MAKRKPKPPHPMLVSIKEAQEKAANDIAKFIDEDMVRARRALTEVADRGDLNITRVTAAVALLKLHGLMDRPTASTTKVTTQQPDGGRVEVVIVEDTKPHAEDDDD